MNELDELIKSANEYRVKHPRCRYCKHANLYITPCKDKVYRCLVKDKRVGKCWPAPVCNMHSA